MNDNYEKLRAFSYELLMHYTDEYIEEIAAKYGLVEKIEKTKPCGEQCSCAEFYSDEDFEMGITCYRIVDWIKE